VVTATRMCKSTLYSTDKDVTETSCTLHLWLASLSGDTFCDTDEVDIHSRFCDRAYRPQMPSCIHTTHPCLLVRLSDLHPTQNILIIGEFDVFAAQK
jgi:hypothetical protein